MSHDTQVKPEAPERIFAVIGKGSELTMAIWATFDARDKAERYPGPRMLECAPRQVVEYVPADLLATVRREAFKEAITLVQSVTNENDLDDGGFFEAGFIAARTKSIDTLIEASATEKGEVNG